VEGARQILEDVLAVEVVPMYRQIAQTQLDALDE
jgi:DUSAM domain-containing protein